MQSETTAVALTAQMNTASKGALVSALALFLLLPTASFAQGDNAPKVEFKIESQPMETALTALGAQSGLTIIVETKVSKGVRAQALSGSYTAEEALKKLLEPAGLKADYLDNKTVAIRLATSTSLSREGRGIEGALNTGTLRLAQNTGDTGTTGLQNQEEQSSSNKESGEAAPANPDKDSADPLEEVVVTGTHIRGGGRGASPVYAFDREAIERSGAISTQQFIESLPQNFAGGASEGAVDGAANGGAGGFSGNASGANLRGLGNVATLTLLNGRRMAPAGVGETVDLSLIPVGVIERIEVLPDGASAIYGSDAVAGVVNIILRKEFTGLETRLRAGTVTDGSHDEHQIGQTAGFSWGSGNAFIDYSYAERTGLSAEDRPFTENSPGTFYLMSPEERHGVLLAAQQQLSDRLTLYADALYGERDSTVNVNFGAQLRQEYATRQFAVNTGVNVGLGSSWQIDVSFGHSRNKADRDFFVDQDAPFATDTKYDVRNIDVIANGALFDVSGGPVKLAVGSQYREETLNRLDNNVEEDRDISAAFAELLVPLVGADNALAGVQELELTVAWRYEEYSDFGSTDNPKIGLRWSPFTGLNIRSTYGTSFRAPLLNELSTAIFPHSALSFLFPDPTAPSGEILALYLSGNNPDLKPERADTFSFGFELTPERLAGSSFSLTYFDVDYVDRIQAPLFDTFTDVLLREDEFQSVLTRADDLSAEVAFWQSQPGGIFDVAGRPLSEVRAIVDDRLRNIAGIRQSGLDFNMGLEFDNALGKFELETAAVYLLSRERQITPTAPIVDTASTAYNPTDFKLRGGLSWARGTASAALFINYTDNYRDIRPSLEGRVSSWTTFDLNTDYKIEEGAGVLSGTSLSLSVRNLLNKDPPFLTDPSWSINYDGSNANPLGRFISAGLRKHW